MEIGDLTKAYDVLLEAGVHRETIVNLLQMCSVAVQDQLKTKTPAELKDGKDGKDGKDTRTKATKAKENTNQEIQESRSGKIEAEILHKILTESGVGATDEKNEVDGDVMVQGERKIQTSVPVQDEDIDHQLLLESGYSEQEARNALVQRRSIRTAGNNEVIGLQEPQKALNNRNAVEINSRIPELDNSKKKIPTSYAQALTGLVDPPAAATRIISPKREDGKIKVFVDEDEYKKDLAKNENCVLGRLFMQDGCPNLSTQELKKRLMKIWGIDFKLLLLGKGYFHIQTTSTQDQLHIRKQSVYDLKPGIFRTYKWQQDFNPFGKNITTTQVWIRIHGLPLEYWGPTTLNNIALGVGTPIRIEDDYKHALYARILVDVDLASSLPTELYVTKKDNSEFCVRVEYERLPSFCEVCGVIGHSRMECKKLERKRTNLKTHQEKAQLRNVQVVQNNAKEGMVDRGNGENLGVIRNTVIKVMQDCVKTGIVEDLISNSGKNGNSTTGKQNKEVEGENKLEDSKVKGGTKGKSSKQKIASEVPLSNIWDKLNDVVEMPVVDGKEGGSNKEKGSSKSPHKAVMKKDSFPSKASEERYQALKKLGPNGGVFDSTTGLIFESAITGKEESRRSPSISGKWGDETDSEEQPLDEDESMEEDSYASMNYQKPLTRLQAEKLRIEMEGL